MTRAFANLGLALVACRAAPPVDVAAEADRIRARDCEWLAAEARRDFAGMMAIYAPDAREMLPGMPAVVGRDSIEVRFRAVHARHPRLVHRFVPDMVAPDSLHPADRGQDRADAYHVWGS